MSEFWKRPKFWIGAIIILWLAYIIYANSQPRPSKFISIPWFVTLQLKLSAMIIGVAMSALANACDSILLAPQRLLEERGGIGARTPAEQQHRRLIAFTQHRCTPHGPIRSHRPATVN